MFCLNSSLTHLLGSDEEIPSPSLPSTATLGKHRYTSENRAQHKRRIMASEDASRDPSVAAVTVQRFFFNHPLSIHES